MRVTGHRKVNQIVNMENLLKDCCFVYGLFLLSQYGMTWFKPRALVEYTLWNCVWTMPKKGKWNGFLKVSSNLNKSKQRGTWSNLIKCQRQKPIFVKVLHKQSFLNEEAYAFSVVKSSEILVTNYYKHGSAISLQSSLTGSCLISIVLVK